MTPTADRFNELPAYFATVAHSGTIQSFPEIRPTAGGRAANLRFRGAAWRLVFTLDDECRIVTVLALGPHDRAYTEAERRLG